MSIMRRTPAVLALGCLCGALAAAGEIPFPDALRAASVRIEKRRPRASLDISTEGLVVGNGHMNAIVYTSGSDVMLRVTKNDLWDGRIDTSEDPAIPQVDPATGKLHRERPGNPPSWNKPYPCAVPAADVRLSSDGTEAGWTAELDLANAVATIDSGTDRTVVRALARQNVFYIQSRRHVSLRGVPQQFLPTATNGRSEDGIEWLCQSIPGNADIAGMDVYLATASKADRQVVAVVTSTDSRKPHEEAIRLVRQVLAREDKDLIDEHEATWRAFWSRSGVRLDETCYQNWWYRMVYYFGCVSTDGGTAVGLKASMDRLAGWHNSYKFNYNIQQSFFSAGPINHPELAEPLIDVLVAYWPRARWFAQTAFVGCEGAFVHSDVFHPREPGPAVCTTRNRHQFAYIPFGYSLGMQGHIAVILWESYQYRPDEARLREKLYPLLRDIALFYCSFLEKCKTDEDGKYLIGPSYIPENHYFGQYNTAYDVPFITYALEATQAAAGILEIDEPLVQRIGAIRQRMPSYPLYADPAQDGQPIVTYYRGAKLPDDCRHGSLIMGVFPAGQVTWFSSPEEKELFRRSIDLVGRITTRANSPVTLNIARARLSLTDEAITNIAIDFTDHHRECPNGLFQWKGHGTYMSEQIGLSRLISELLLQSVQDTIRVFPAWPPEKDAKFARLRAQGGFLVSAGIQAGKIGPVAIMSTVGGRVRVLNPWPGRPIKILERQTGGAVIGIVEQNVVSFPTRADVEYLLKPDPSSENGDRSP